MVLRAINTVLNVLTRPYFYLQQYFLVTLQSFLPKSLDEKHWTWIFVFIVFLTLFIAYVLSRFVTIRDADDDPVYQRKRFYTEHQKIN